MEIFQLFTTKSSGLDLWFGYDPVKKIFVVAGIRSKNKLTAMHPNKLLLCPLRNVMLS